jgi:hypothetical protein
MKSIMIAPEQTDEEVLAFEVSDAALEIAGICSGLSVCPG